MEQLKKISFYIIISGVLSFFLIFEMDMIETMSILPIGITSLGSLLYLYSDYMLQKHITRKSIVFLIFILSFVSLYTTIFMFSDYMDKALGDTLSMYLAMAIAIPFVLSLIYLIKHSKITRQLFGNLF